MASSTRTSKKRSTHRAKSKAPPPVDREIRDKLVLLLIGGVSSDIARVAAIERFKLTPAKADATVAEAQQAIILAAAVDRRRELGLAMGQLNDLYSKANQAKEVKTALAIRRELNKLLSLYDTDRLAAEAAAAADADGSTQDAQELGAIGAHLIPLDLAPADYPLREHARIAADLVRRAA